VIKKNNMRLIIFTLYASFTVILANAQNPGITLQNYIGGDSDDVMRRVESPSGGYYFIGHSSSNISGDKTENSRGFSDIWIVKTDLTYAVEWDKTIGGDGYDNVTDVAIINDTIYVLTESGSSISGEKTIAPFGSFGFTDLWIVALNLNGNILWQKQYGGQYDESSGTMTLLESGNILISSISNSDISGNKNEAQIGLADLWLVEINPVNGAIVTQKVIGSSLNETLSNVIQLNTGELIIKGGSSQGVSGDKTDGGYGGEDIWLVKLDQNYNVLTNKCFGGDNIDYGSDGQMIEHSGYLYLGCSSQSGTTGNKTAPSRGGIDYWIMKLDLNFNLIWDKSFGGLNDDLIGSIDYYESDRIVICGTSNSGITGNKTSTNYGSYDTWLVILSTNGDEIVQESYGGVDIDAGIAQKQLDGTKIFLTNYSTSGATGNKTVPSHGGYDCWFVELDASSYVSTEEILKVDVELTVYPNPVDDQINFLFTNLNEPVTISFYSIEGKLISSRNVHSSFTNFDIKVKNQVVIYDVQGVHYKCTGKFVVH